MARAGASGAPLLPRPDATTRAGQRPPGLGRLAGQPWRRTGTVTAGAGAAGRGAARSSAATRAGLCERGPSGHARRAPGDRGRATARAHEGHARDIPPHTKVFKTTTKPTHLSSNFLHAYREKAPTPARPCPPVLKQLNSIIANYTQPEPGSPSSPGFWRGEGHHHASAPSWHQPAGPPDGRPGSWCRTSSGGQRPRQDAHVAADNDP